jgi:hypothetical protein
MTPSHLLAAVWIDASKTYHEKEERKRRKKKKNRRKKKKKKRRAAQLILDRTNFGLPLKPQEIYIKITCTTTVNLVDLF